jgi:transposase
MSAPLSTDLRRRIVACVRAGSSRRAAAERFAVSPASGVRLMQRVAETGSIEPGQIGGHRRSPLDAHAATLQAIVAETSDITLAGIRQEVQTRLGLMVGLTAVHAAVHRLGLRHKKSPARGRAGPA